MFQIHTDAPGLLRLDGRLDASQAEHAAEVLWALTGPTTADCTALDYISSAGLGVLVEAHKRLLARGHGLRLVHVSPRVHSVFRMARLDGIFGLDPAPGGGA